MRTENQLTEGNKARWNLGEEWRGYLKENGGTVFEERVVKAKDLLEPTGGSYLDVGCADGVVTREFARKIQADLTCGVDILADKNEGDGIHYLKADLNCGSLPFKDASFQAVSCTETLEHLIDPESILSEVKRVLAPGGIAVFSVPRIDSLTSILLLAAGYQPPAVECSIRKRYGSINQDSRVSGHVSNFTRKAFLEMVSQHGFRAVKVSSASLYSGWALKQKAAEKKLGIPGMLLRLASCIPFKQDVVIVKAVAP